MAGFLADRVGKRDILASTILMYSVGSLIAGVAPNFGVFLFGRAVVGLGVGGEWSIGAYCLIDVSRSSELAARYAQITNTQHHVT